MRVRGKVQGVFFRKSTEEKAKELGLKGWVRNESDGSVYLEAQGPEEEVRSLISWCHDGPPQAEVTQVSFSESALQTDEDDFTVHQ